MINEVQITELQVGHYVVDIVKQQGSYNLTQAGHIKSELIINKLKSKGVTSVLVDSSKSILQASEQQSPDSRNNTPVILEITKAKKIFSEAKNIQKKVFDDALNGRPIELEAVIEITNKTIDAIIKNSEALACVINIRNKDEYLLEHSVSVSVLMTIFAHFIKIDRQIIEQLAIGAFLHDVGKIMIPEQVLNKPNKLTDNEFRLMKSHVDHSIDIMKKTPNISKLSIEVAALHHEKLNGQGYPRQLQDKAINKYGRMIAICDIFDALTANRCYKNGYSHVKAFSILRRLSEQAHLDQRMVDLFIRCMGVYPVGSLVELQSNKLAIVEARNDRFPTKPKVRSFYNTELHHYEMTKDIDLSTSEEKIVKGVRADDFDLDMNKIIEFLLMEG